LFHPSSQKRGLEYFLSIASVQTYGIEKLVCWNHVFAEFFKQASVKASRFDVIDNFMFLPDCWLQFQRLQLF